MSDARWAWPINSRKAHLFRDGRSLCGRWMMLAEQPDQPQHRGDEPGADDCRECWRRGR